MVAGILEKSKRLRNPFFFDIRKTPKLFCSAGAASPWKTRALWRCPIQGPVKKKITQQRTRTFRHSAPPARDNAELPVAKTRVSEDAQMRLRGQHVPEAPRRAHGQ